jgi:hypothetical protein
VEEPDEARAGADPLLGFEREGGAMAHSPSTPPAARPVRS